ncbi:MAG: hypothetical protein JWM68_3558 [Verrucomicrobiales bacterium]|nr:hypothetical protein [Verrucomicrobiales bacterium]
MTFTLQVTGSPTEYQWLVNGGPIEGAISSSYTITNVQAGDEGFYSAHVANADGEADTNPSELTVIIPPTIITQPLAPTDPVLDPDSYTFSVEAEGSALAYQWRLNGTNLVGETDSSIIATKAGNYSVKVSNDILGGASVISITNTLVVWFSPLITVQPTSRTILAGKPTTFSVTATGSKPLNYRWSHDDIEIDSATNSSYTIKTLVSSDAGIYKVHIWNETNTIYQETYSEPAELLVLVPPKILTQPLSQTANPGEDVTFTVEIQDDATFPVSYQWRFNGTNIDISLGGDSQFLYVPNVDGDSVGVYSVVITNTGGIVTSANASLAVRRPPLITSQPQDARVGFGTNVTFSVRATGSSPFYYQWMFNDAVLSGATNSSLAFKAISANQDGLYSVFVSNAVDVVTSTPAILTVIAETVLPTVTITNPTLSFMTVTNPAFNFAGKAADNIAVTKVLCQLNTDPFTAANGTVIWNTNLTLTPGTNFVRAKSIDSSGNSSVVASRTVFYSVKSLLTLVTNGPGTITGLPNLLLEVNRAYTITAKPGVGQIFAGWSGGISNNSAILRFVMKSNLVLQAKFIPDPFQPHKGVYNGLFYETNGVRQISSGAFTMTLYDKGGASGKIYMGGSSYTFTNHFEADGVARFDVLRLGLTSLSLTLKVNFTNGTDEVSGTVSNSAWKSTLLGDRNIYSKTVPSPFAGIYSVVIPGKTNNGVPLGDGFAVATIDSSGNVRVSGALSDGTVLTQGTTVSKNGDWPFYAPLYTGKGFILSWVTLANTNDLGGDFSWFRPTMTTSKLFPSGFTNLTSVDGGVFIKPAKGTRVLNFTNGLLSLNGGNLPTGLTNSVVLTTNNTLVISSTNHLALKLNTTNGLITGSFTHPKTKLTTQIKGILVRQQDQGYGFFLGTNQGGVFLLEGN